MLTISLDSPSSNQSNAGGKGCNLSILIRCGDIPVPPGFVVTVEAYQNFINQNDEQLLKVIQAALNNGSEQKDNEEGKQKEDVEDISQTIRSAFRKQRLPEILQAEVNSRLSNLFPNEQQYYFAVRSSATCEDMPDASFAGQHDTYLNVSRDDVCKRIIDCFSSLFTPRAISYRDRVGLPHLGDGVGMAVVVQTMAESQISSGVLFTANPLTGRRGESVLEAIPGLGEALVSGLTEPDRYVVARGRCDDGKEDGAFIIKDRRIGAKAKAIRAVDGGGVKEETISIAKKKCGGDESLTSVVLTDDDVTKIVQLGQQVEELFNGKPQDIEWAQSSDGQIFVVQSRPITTLFPLPNVPAEPLQVYFSFNAVQGIVAPIYPAGQDAVRRGLLGGLLRWITFAKYGNEGVFIQTVAERLYINVTNLLRNSIGRKILCKLLPAIEPGSMVALEQFLDNPEMSLNGGMTPRFLFRILTLYSVIIPRFLLTVLFPDWSRRRLIRRINAFVDDVEKRVDSASSLSDVIELERRVFESFFPLLVPHLGPRFVSGFECRTAMPFAFAQFYIVINLPLSRL